MLAARDSACLLPVGAVTFSNHATTTDMNRDAPNAHSMDSLLPPEMAAKAEQVGVKKANMDARTMFALAFLAGAFIALGAVFATTVASGFRYQPNAPL